MPQATISSPPSTGPTSGLRKRKAPPTDSTAISSAVDGEAAAKKAKRVKAKNKKKAKRAEEDETLFDLEQGINTAFAFMDPSLAADYLAKKIEWAGKELSTVELSDLGLGASLIHDTTSFQNARTLPNMAEFIEQFASTKNLMRTPKEKGAPHTIVVVGAGMRAADVVRAMRKFERGKIKVAKCFAKHIKMEEVIKFLETHKTGVAVGTPQRLVDLVENGSLNVDNLEQLVVDASYIDEKKRGVLDMKETLLPLCKWLNMSQFQERYSDEEKPLRLMFY